MDRKQMLSQLAKQKVWDLAVIGGGATGMGIAVDAAQRGYSTLLLEQCDFGKGTSSKSTKLVHGGVRYLAQGNIKLVREALRERGLFLRHAPHLTQTLEFIVPIYHWWEKWYYGAGLKIYDLLAGRLGLGSTRILSKAAVLEKIPVADPGGLRGGVAYTDGQFDDTRMLINLARTAEHQGAVLLNYMRVSDLVATDKKIQGLIVHDELSGERHEVHSKAVINATGAFVDNILKLDEPGSGDMVAPSQGVHIVVDKKFFPGRSGLLVPKTADGRVLYAVPWHDHVVVGTTDTPVSELNMEPLPFREEISFIIYHFNKYLTSELRESDIKSIFTGLRPLVRTSNSGKTAMLARDHTIVVSTRGLVTITGGKWTTYRKMAKDAVDNAAFIGKLEPRPCKTDELPIHGWVNQPNLSDPLRLYGSDADQIRAMVDKNPELGEKMHPDLPYIWAEVHWAVSQEMAMRLEDVLARRLRLLFLDARMAIELSQPVAVRMARLLGKDSVWVEQEIESFRELATGYLP